MKKRVVIGTAGHIDHGKTAMVKTITGINTDRLAEEQKRGITIDLGYAHAQLDKDICLSIVDVPGHEKFVRNMVAGASGIDLVLFVIAADEGIMPQTMEHLDICQLLGVKKGIIVITKTDLVDEEWLEMVKAEIIEKFATTFLKDASIVEFSAVSGNGKDDLIAQISTCLQSMPERPQDGIFFMPIDRVFTIKGFGTVVTGTVISGSITGNDLVDILPHNLAVRVRGLQNHGDPVNLLLPGQRGAVNLQGISKNIITRGAVLTGHQRCSLSDTLDCRLQLLPIAKSIKNRTTLSLHTGTAQVMATVLMLQGQQMSPGQKAFVQLRCSPPLVTLAGEHFILRGFTARKNHGYTIGGGVILDPMGQKIKRRFRQEKKESLAVLSSPHSVQRVEKIVYLNGLQGINRLEIEVRTRLFKKKIENLVSQLLNDQKIFQIENSFFIHHRHLEKLSDDIFQELSDFHKQNPYTLVMEKNQLNSKFSKIKPGAIELAIFHLKTIKKIEFEDNGLRMAGHNAGGKKVVGSILEMVGNRKDKPPTEKELMESLKLPEKDLKQLAGQLTNDGKIVIIDHLCFLPAHLKEIENKIRKHLSQNKYLTTQEFKSITNLSRKYSIPLAEYFDRQRVTLRIPDNKRVLRGSG